jgi:broad specificity phosphatase PhoE
MAHFDNARTLALVFAAICVMGSGVPALSQVRPNDLDLVKALQAGGHTIVMRHATADPDKADIDPLNFKSIKTQQPLTEQGRQGAKSFGAVLTAIAVPVAEVLTSRFHRAVQTATLAGFKVVKPTIDLTEGSLVASPNENRRRAVALRKLVATQPTSGQNRLLVTHKANIIGAFGKEWFEVKEGEASIFKVENSAYSLVARLQLDEWSRLAQALASSRPASSSPANSRVTAPGELTPGVTTPGVTTPRSPTSGSQTSGPQTSGPASAPAVPLPAPLPAPKTP